MSAMHTAHDPRAAAGISRARPLRFVMQRRGHLPGYVVSLKPIPAFRRQLAAPSADLPSVAGSDRCGAPRAVIGGRVPAGSPGIGASFRGVPPCSRPPRVGIGRAARHRCEARLCDSRFRWAGRPQACRPARIECQQPRASMSIREQNEKLRARSAGEYFKYSMFLMDVRRSRLPRCASAGCYKSIPRCSAPPTTPIMRSCEGNQPEISHSNSAAKKI